jgi:hypothetical protein
MQITTYGTPGVTAAVPVTPPVDAPPVSTPVTPPPAPIPGAGLTETVAPSTMTGQPVLIDMLKPSKGNVMQSVVYNTKRKEYYMSQAVPGSNGKRDPYETTVVNRMDANGKQLDQMILTDAGHGTGLVVETVGSKNTVYLWATFQTDSNNYYRFAYTKGTFTFSKVPGKKKVPKFTSAYATYHVDWEDDVLMERTINADTTQTLKKRKISEVLANKNVVYATIVTEPVVTRQGWATLNDSAYILQGATNGEQLTPPDLNVLDTYNWNTGARVDRVDITQLGKEGNDWSLSTHEPEGLSVYRDPTTKKGTLLLGINTGVGGTAAGHRWFVYGYKNIGNAP